MITSRGRSLSTSVFKTKINYSKSKSSQCAGANNERANCKERTALEGRAICSYFLSLSKVQAAN